MEKYALTVQRIGLVAITNLLVALSGVILLPILTKTLPITSYGTWALILVTIGLLPVLTSLGLRQTMVRFLAASKDKHQIREVFYSLAFVVFAAALQKKNLIFFTLLRQYTDCLFRCLASRQ
jgi:O-antigen/teichoic acid export membrane protein